MCQLQGAASGSWRLFVLAVQQLLPVYPNVTQVISVTLLASDMLTDNRDKIKVNELSATLLLLGGARWPSKVPGRATAQPVLISISIPHDVTKTASTDDLSYSINYSTISSSIRNSIDATTSLSFESLEDVSRHIFSILSSPKSLDTPAVDECSLKIVQTKPPLHCKSVGVESTAVGNKVTQVRQFVEALDCDVIVGVNSNERLEKQLVRLNISVDNHSTDLERGTWLDFRSLIRRLYEASYAPSR